MKNDIKSAYINFMLFASTVTTVIFGISYYHNYHYGFSTPTLELGLSLITTIFFSITTLIKSERFFIQNNS